MPTPGPDPSPDPGHSPGWRAGLAHVFEALRYSLDGLRAAATGEIAFRQELVLFGVLVPAAVWVSATFTQAAILVGSMFGVLIVELLNSAIEATVDRISLERHDLAKRAKDIGSAAVLLSLVNCVVCWGLVLTDVFLGSASGVR